MNADPIARAYRFVEHVAFGHALESARFCFLPLISDARRILILGEGDGRFLTRLVQQNRRSEIDVIDSSARMLDLARRSTASPRVRFHHQDALHAPLPAGPYDLVVTHFFLDCFTSDEAATVIPKIADSIGPEGRWLLCEFRQPEGALRRLHANLWLAVMYRFFRVTTGLKPLQLPPYEPLLTTAGFHRTHYHEARLGLITSQLWQSAPTG